MDEVVKTAFISETSTSASLQVQPLKAEEEQALRYVAGEQVNRGGLFRINNDTYLVFRAMEFASRCVVNVERVASHPTVKIQEEVQSSIMNDPSFTAHWNYLLTKAEAFDTDEYDELLGEIVDKWIKIRSHSFATGWIEQYQLATKQKERTPKISKTK